MLVAPFVGAWIETRISKSYFTLIWSLPSWERGLKHQLQRRQSERSTSLPSWERGLKLRFCFCFLFLRLVAPFVGAWIETWLCLNSKDLPRVAPFVGAWIETEDRTGRSQRRRVAPFVGAWIETGRL